MDRLGIEDQFRNQLNFHHRHTAKIGAQSLASNRTGGHADGPSALTGRGGALRNAHQQEETMELGYFTMPSHPPERSLKDDHE